MQLQRRIDHPLRGLGRLQLGHGGLAADAGRAHVLGPGRAIDEERRRIDVERHVRDMALHHLQLRQRLPADPARLHARQRLVQRAAGKAEGRRADRGRKTSSTDNRQLEALPRAPISAPSDSCTPSSLRRASGCGAMTSIRSATASPGLSAGIRKAERPRVPGASPYGR